MVKLFLKKVQVQFQYKAHLNDKCNFVHISTYLILCFNLLQILTRSHAPRLGFMSYLTFKCSAISRQMQTQCTIETENCSSLLSKIRNIIKLLFSSSSTLKLQIWKADRAINSLRISYTYIKFKQVNSVTLLHHPRSFTKHNTQNTATYILESLDAAPPVTFATRRLVSSVLSSSSCFSSSFLSLVRSSEHLTLPCRQTKDISTHKNWQS